MKTIVFLVVFALLTTLTSGSSVAQTDDAAMSQQEVTSAVNNLIRAVDKDYLFDGKRGLLVDHFTTALNSGEFNGHFPFGRFKRKLESMLTSVSHDTNFEIQWRTGITNRTEQSTERFPGAIQTRLLEDDVGYIAIDGDLTEDFWLKEMDSAMAFLSPSKALIIDLRSAGLSSLGLSQHVLSYFIPAGQELADISLGRNNGYRMTSNGMVTNAIPANVPVYIVTSPFIAGAWEFVAYTLKHEDRATVVGMPTIGLGYLTKTVALSEHINLILTHAGIHHPDTGDNWHGWGVLPDIRRDADNAAETAIKLANEAVTMRNRN